jgi:hypothetical protein
MLCISKNKRQREKEKKCKLQQPAYFRTCLCELGYAVEHLVEALSYKPADRGFDSGWGRCDFSLT